MGAELNRVAYTMDNLSYAEALKALVTLGTCQRPVSSLGVSQHMHKITKSVKILSRLVLEVAHY